MILCPNCHNKELPGALYCSVCGTALVSIDTLNTRSIQKTPSDTLSTPQEIPQVLTRKSSTISKDSSISLHLIESGQVLHLNDRKEFTLGRVIEGQPVQPDIDLLPFDAFTLGVSCLHAALRIINDQVVITDLGSSNGSRLNGQKIVPHVDYPVTNGDVFMLGKLKIQIIISK